MKISCFLTFYAQTAPPPLATLKTKYYLSFRGGFGGASRRQGDISAENVIFCKIREGSWKSRKSWNYALFVTFRVLG